MRLFEAILDANARKVAGEREARVPTAEFATALPLAALTCIDARLNHLLPDALGIPEEQFIWLRNAGNIITGPLSSTMRSLTLACAVKGAKEIAIIGHSDCQVGKTTTLTLLDRLATLGVDRHRLPENLLEYFGLFGSERQNVLRGVEFVRTSPLIGPKIPVHGLLLDLATGRLEWIANGYQAPEAALSGKAGEALHAAEKALNTFTRIGNFAAEELKLPTAKIGELSAAAHDWLQKAEQIGAAVQSKLPPPAATGTDPKSVVIAPVEVIRRLAKTPRQVKPAGRQ
jgi:carbonic anhydrase